MPLYPVVETKDAHAVTACGTIAGRVESLAWDHISQDLDAHGCATIKALLTEQECEALAALYPKDDLFRSKVGMARHGFGRGEYKYFDYPLPDIVAGLRESLYPRLAPIANHWNEAMRIDIRYPEQHADFIARCHDAGQLKPTPLLMSRTMPVNRRCPSTRVSLTASSSGNWAPSLRRPRTSRLPPLVPRAPVEK